MKRIGITGSRGFLGRHLIKALKLKGNIDLSFFDLPENNLLKPGQTLAKFISNKDVIIHAAAINRGADTEVIAGSVAATYNLISAIKKTKSKAKLIFLSSVQAETETLYGQSKKLTEIMLEDFSEENKIPVSVFRLANVFGEGGRPFYNSVVATFCHQVAKGQELIIHPGSCNKKLNLIYVEDVAKLIVKEVFTKRKMPFYFKRVSSKNEISVYDLAKLIESFKNPASQKKLKSKFQKDLHKTYLSFLK